MRLARSVPRAAAADQLDDAFALAGVDHRDQERQRLRLAAGAEPLHGAGETSGLHLREFAGQFFALLRRIELTMAPIEGAGARFDEILGDNSLSTRFRLCLVIRRMSSSAAMVRPGCRLTKCSTR